jgi:hypothetical protein
MTTVRACSVVNTSHSEPKMWTLWECEPEHQKGLEAWVAGYRLVWDRGDGPDTALAWKDFSSAQALEEANQRLHDAQWLDEVDMMLSDNLMCEEQIATVGQRLHQQQELHRTQARESFPKLLAERASRNEAQQLAFECEEGMIAGALKWLEDADNSGFVLWFENMLAKLHRLRVILENK